MLFIAFIKRVLKLDRGVFIWWVPQAEDDDQGRTYKGDGGRKGVGAGGFRASGRSDSPRVLSRPVVGTSGVLNK